MALTIGRKNRIAGQSFFAIGILALLTLCTNTKINETNNEPAETVHVIATKATRPMMDYEVIPLPKMIGISDFIVIGSVKELGDSTFIFDVQETLLGELTFEELDIKMFIPSKFDGPRMLPYAIDQRFLLFLSMPSEENTSLYYTILGYGGEGEMPIEAEFLYFSGYHFEGLASTTAKVHGVERVLQRFSLVDFKDAVKNYGQCFVWAKVEEIKNNKKRERLVPSKKCPDAEMNTYQSKGWMHDYLFRETMSRIP